MIIKFGTNGDDTINGAGGADLLVGGNGDDTLRGKGGNDLLVGGNGDDKLRGGSGNDVLLGGNGEDNLKGGKGDDVLLGGNGSDTLKGGAGSDYLNGGRGDDLLIFEVLDNVGESNHYDGSKGIDTLLVRLTQAQLDELTASSVLTSFSAVAGTSTVFDFSTFGLSFEFNLSVTRIENIQFEIIPGPNTQPIANNDAFSIAENEGAIGSLLDDNGNGADVDPDGDDLMVVAVEGSSGNVGIEFSLASGALVTVAADGSFVYDQNVAFSDLEAGQTAHDSFAYTISDGNGGIATATAFIEIIGSTDETIIGDVNIGSLAITSNDVSITGDTTLQGTIAGGQFFTKNAIIGNQFGSQGSAIVSGNGALLSVFDGNLSVGLEGTGSLRIEGGGQVLIDSGNQDINVPGDFQDVVVGGSSTGVGDLTISGTGSLLSTIGTDNVVRVGFNGGTGTLLIEEGGHLETLFFEVGRNGSSTGTATITGAGSTVFVTSENGRFSPPFDFESGFARLGRNGADGTLNVLDGGRLEIRSGSNNNTDTTDPGLNLGQEGSTGTALVDGVGSTISITQSNPNTGFFGGPFLQIGRGDDAGILGGDGYVTVSNNGRIELIGVSSIISMGSRDDAVGGNTSEGVLEINTGGEVLVDGTANGLSIVNLGQGTGTSGTLTIDGSGSNLIVTGANAQLNSASGANSTGEISVTNGGQVIVNADSANGANVQIGVGDGSNGSLTINGSDSSLSVSAGNLGIGFAGTGSVRIENGGQVTVDSGNQDVTMAGDFQDVVVGGSSTGVGDLTISGTGSLLSTIGTDNVVSIGVNGGIGELLVEDGGQLETLFLRVGRDGGSSGAATITGTDTTVLVSTENGRFSQPFDFESGFVSVGRLGADGTLNVLDGGRLEIRQGSTNNTDTTDPGINLGRQGGTGTALVDGAGSTISVVQANPNQGVFGGPFFGIGRGDNAGMLGGDGFVTVSNGGRIELIGVSSSLYMGARDVAVGGTASLGVLDINSGGEVFVDGTLNGLGLVSVGRGAGNEGIMNIDGPDSSLMITGKFADLRVGRDADSSAEVTVTNAASITVGDTNTESAIATVGLGENSDATLSMDGAGSELFISAGTGFTRFSVGGQGDGMVKLTNGAAVRVEALDDFYSSFVAGDFAHGDIDILSGSQIIVDGLGNSVFASFATQASGSADVLVSGPGSLLAVGGLTQDAGSAINLSAQEFQGPAVFTVENGGEVRTDTFLVGDDGFVFGESGLLTANDVRIEGGEIGKIGTVGTFEVDGNIRFGDYIPSPGLDAFTINIDIAGSALGDFDLTHVSGTAQFNNSVPGLLNFNFQNVFAPLAGDTFEFFVADGGITNAPSLTDLSYVFSGLSTGFDGDLQVTTDSLQLVANNSASFDAGVDVFFGGSQDDVFEGGAGNDILNGGAGNDVLTGGLDNDTFVFDNVGSNDIVTDFEAGIGIGDQLDFTAFGFADFAAVLSASTEVGDDIQIQLDADDFVLLQNLDLIGLAADDFLV